MQMPINRLVTGVLGSIFLLACKGGGGGPIPLEDLDDELIDAICDQGVACGDYSDHASCLSANPVVGSDIPGLQEAVDDGRIIYHEDKAGQCLNNLSGLGCNFSSQPDDVDELLRPCEETFEGTVADGGTCYIDEECVSGGCDVPSCPDACCAGTCEPTLPEPPKAAIGQDCAQADCVSGAYCQTQPDDSEKCAAKVGENQPCDAFDACSQGLACDFDFMTGMGTCKRLPQQGDPCEVDSFLPCDRSDNFCDPTSLTCAKKRGEGESCSDTPDACLDWTECIGGSCVRRPDAVGEACGSATGDCLGNLDCGTGGTCEAPAPDPICP